MKNQFQHQLPDFSPPTAKPFLKWAGGKTQLITQIKNFFPKELEVGEIEKYAEPFVGSGAVFFFIAANYPHIKQFYISDINRELILAYKTIRHNVEGVIGLLAEMQKNYSTASPDGQRKMFDRTRNEFNNNLSLMNFRSYRENWVERTAQVIFLNRTCFNGLFRVNSKGEFNVPFGRYKNPLILAEGNLRAVSALLKCAEIRCGDFTDCRKFVNAKTFVYFDPPYRPISKTASFTSYSTYNFDDAAQRRLAQFYRELDRHKAKLMLSNSDPKNNDSSDHFFEDLYDGDFQIKRVKASRMINSDASKRGRISELLILNYSTHQ